MTGLGGGLFPPEKPAQPVGILLQDSPNRAARALRRDLGSGQPSVEMRFDRRMSGGKCAALSRFGPANRAPDRQYLSQREFRFHNMIVRHRRSEILLNLARFLDGTDTKTQGGRRGTSPRTRSRWQVGPSKPALLSVLNLPRERSQPQGTQLRTENRELRTAFRSIIKRLCPSTPS
jgi:hypothetical protein